jgi:hypothetical protein
MYLQAAYSLAAEGVINQRAREKEPAARGYVFLFYVCGEHIYFELGVSAGS